MGQKWAWPSDECTLSVVSIETLNRVFTCDIIAVHMLLLCLKLASHGNSTSSDSCPDVGDAVS